MTCSFQQALSPTIQCKYRSPRTLAGIVGSSYHHGVIVTRCSEHGGVPPVQIPSHQPLQHGYGQSIVRGQGGEDDRPQLERVPSQHQLTTPACQQGHRDETLWFKCLSSFIHKHIRECYFKSTQYGSRGAGTDDDTTALGLVFGFLIGCDAETLNEGRDRL